MNNIIKIDLIDDTSKIDVELTDYNDKQVRDDIEELRQTKVDKIVGKGLSTNDYTTPEKTKLASLENYDDSKVRALIDTKQPRGNYLTQETDPTVPNHVKNISQNNINTWNNKADMSDIPDVSNFVTKTVNDLENYYKNTETFTKQEVNDLISAISTLDLQVVQTLPTEDISTTTIYLVPKTTTETNDVYDEYIYVSNAWEHIGSTQADLTDYVKNTDYAGSNKVGVIRTNTDYGTSITSVGALISATKTYQQYLGAATNNMFISKGTLENVITGKGLVNNTDYATSSVGGVIKCFNSDGLKINNGTLITAVKSYAQYNSAGNWMFVGKGTLENVITGKKLDLKQLSTFDSTKTQVLKNINGTLTWVDE